MLIAALAAYAAFASPAFRTTENVANILQQSIVLGLVAIGQTFVILSGGIDFSVAGIVKITSMVAAIVMESTGQIAPGVAVAIALGLAIGLTNGLVVTFLNAAPFIATFGMFGVLQGLVFTIATAPVGIAPESFLNVYDTRLGPVAAAVPVAAALWVLAWVVVTRTPLGRRIYAVGGDAEVARLAGIRVRRVRLTVYMLSGLLSSLAGLYLLAQAGVGDPSAGDGLEFKSATAVALGGASLFGGSGSLVGTLGGVFLLSLIANVFNILQISVWYQGMLEGSIILLAVAIYRQRHSSN